MAPYRAALRVLSCLVTDSRPARPFFSRVADLREGYKASPARPALPSGLLCCALSVPMAVMDPPSTLKPAQVAVAMVESGVLKHRTRADLVFFKAVLAGVMLSYGGLLSEIVGGGSAGINATNPGLVKLLSGAVFPVGLVMIVLQGHELLTSNMMIFPMAIIKGAVPWWGLPWNWLIVTFGNLCGSLFFATVLTKCPCPGAPAAVSQALTCIPHRHRHHLDGALHQLRADVRTPQGKGAGVVPDLPARDRLQLARMRRSMASCRRARHPVQDRRYLDTDHDFRHRRIRPRHREHVLRPPGHPLRRRPHRRRIHPQVPHRVLPRQRRRRAPRRAARVLFFPRRLLRGRAARCRGGRGGGWGGGRGRWGGQRRERGEGAAGDVRSLEEGGLRRVCCTRGPYCVVCSSRTCRSVYPGCCRRLARYR
ncbi:hypothetical protein AcW1_003782 [Taiwanofungus camphoratus]|nr:hypothetical protein AcW1_003782 [Antrodia cinnamomea]